MKHLIIEYGHLLAAIGAVFLFALFQWQKFKNFLYQLMLAAKSMAKDMILNSGTEQEEWVVRKVYQLIPPWISVVLPEELTRELIRKLYHAVKDYTDDGLINNSI